MDIALRTSTQKWFFVVFNFFTYAVWGLKHKTSTFREKKSKIFWSLKKIWCVFCAIKEHSKLIFCWLQFVQPSRERKIKVLKWSALTQRTARSSFCWQDLRKTCCMMWKACFYFLYTIVTLNVSILLSMCVCLQMSKKRISRVWIKNRMKWMNEILMYKIHVFNIFMYKILKVCIFVYIYIYIYIYICKYNGS